MLYKRGRYYHYDFVIAGERYRGTTKQTCETKAQTMETRLMAEALNRKLPTHKAPRLTDIAPRFFTWLDQVIASGYRKTLTKRYYQNGWARIKDTDLATMHLDRIDAESVQTLNLSGSAAWVNQAIRTLRRMLGKAEEWKLIRQAPRLPLRPEVERQSTITTEIEAKILRHAGRTLHDAVVFMQDCGLRREEITRSQIENIDWQQRTYFNPSGKRPRSRRLVPLGDRVFDMLFVRAAGKTQGWLFPSKRSKSGHVSPDSLSRAFARARDKAGVAKDVVLYSGRHTFGTVVYDRTKNLKVVMDSMGHADVRTAMRYQHPELDQVREAIDARNREAGQMPARIM